MRINEIRILVYDLHNRGREEGFANYKMNVEKTQESFDERDELRLEALRKESTIMEELTDLNILLCDLHNFLTTSAEFAHGDKAEVIEELLSRVDKKRDYSLKELKELKQ